MCAGAAKRDHNPPDGLPGRAHECMASRGSWVCSVPAEDCAAPSMGAHRATGKLYLLLYPEKDKDTPLHRDPFWMMSICVHPYRASFSRSTPSPTYGQVPRPPPPPGDMCSSSCLHQESCWFSQAGPNPQAISHGLPPAHATTTAHSPSLSTAEPHLVARSSLSRIEKRE